LLDLVFFIIAKAGEIEDMQFAGNLAIWKSDLISILIILFYIQRLQRFPYK